jgi:low affinity Fe/Cu permease
MAANSDKKLSPNRSMIGRLFADIAQTAAREVGRAWVFALAVITVVVWAATGPLFGFSDTWQLVINTGTTIITFLMVFLIQNAQNRDAAAIQVKLDELIRVSRAHNSFVGIEHLTDEELEELRVKSEKRAGLAGGTHHRAPEQAQKRPQENRRQDNRQAQPNGKSKAIAR